MPCEITVNSGQCTTQGGWISNDEATQLITFLDTEFTDLLQPQLLSLGLVAMDGRELYAELDMATDIGIARSKSSSDFVRNSGVLSQWGLVPGAACTQWEMGRKAGEWLIGLAVEASAKIEVAFDYTADFELLEFAIRDAGLWEQVREAVIPINVNSFTGTITGELAAEECYQVMAQRGLMRHHALADAWALRSAYMSVKAKWINRNNSTSRN